MLLKNESVETGKYTQVRLIVESAKGKSGVEMEKKISGHAE